MLAARSEVERFMAAAAAGLGALELGAPPVMFQPVDGAARFRPCFTIFTRVPAHTYARTHKHIGHTLADGLIRAGPGDHDALKRVNNRQHRKASTVGCTCVRVLQVKDEINPWVQGEILGEMMGPR